MTTELGLMGIVTLITLAASGGALYVSMKVSGTLATFKNDLLKELDDRYVRQHEYSQMESMRKELENNYRMNTKSQLEGLEVEVRKEKDDLIIALKNISIALNAIRNDSPRRGGRS